jgi:hypothetical protein
MSQVKEVTEVKLSLAKSKPPQLQVKASGKVPTTGWTNGTLTAFVYIQKPPDGIQDFDFSATPPDGPSGDMVSDIEAGCVIPDPDNYWGHGQKLVGVRIHAANNSMEALYSPAEAGANTFDHPVPWPHITQNTTKVSFPSLIGKQLRVYKTGDALTMDLVFNRANIEISPETNLIVGAWIG